jgi:hypothetical protein
MDYVGIEQIGAGQLTFVNEGVIVADGNQAIVIHMESPIIQNSGMLEISGNGGVPINSEVTELIVCDIQHIAVQENMRGNGSALPLPRCRISKIPLNRLSSSRYRRYCR